MVARRTPGQSFHRAALPRSVVIFAILALPSPAAAYVGPGAGLTAIGIVVALLAAIVLALVGFVWYPLRRLLGKRRRKGADASAPGDTK